MRRRTRIAASACALAVVGGAAAAAGVLVHNSSGSASAPAAPVESADVATLFPGHRQYARQNFLAAIRKTDVSLPRIVDVERYLRDGVKAFRGTGEGAVRELVGNAVANATGWPERSRYAKDPGAYVIDYRWETVAPGTIHVAFGVHRQDGAFFYDVGRLAV